MKVLIIDDEKSTRESIKMLTGFQEEYDQIYEAVNGLEGYRLLECVSPELVFLDMDMPLMDGTQFLELVEQLDIKAKIIVVSGYTDFKYTRAAITNENVIDYIQKPIDQEKIRETVYKATKNKKYLDKINTRTLNERVNKENVQLCAIFSRDYQHVIKEHFNGLKDLFTYFLLSQIEHQLMNVEVYTPKIKIYEYAVYFKVQHAVDNNMRYAMDSLLKSLITRYSIDAYIIYSTALLSRDLEKVCVEMAEGFNYINIDEKVKVYEMREPSNIELNKELIANHASELVDLMLAKKAIEPYLEKALYEITPCGVNINNLKIYASSLLFEINNKLNEREIVYEGSFLKKIERIYNVSTMFDFAYCLTYLKEVLEGVCENVTVEKKQVPIRMKECMEYLKQNYNQRLNQQEVAKLFGFHPSTLSRMFHQCIGINYIDYLNVIRIESAKALLQNPDCTISDVTYDVGYESVSYFSKKFKEIVGIGPKKYQKEMNQSEK